jgi:hypothetical protein
MAASADEELGPIDYVLVEFPPGTMSFDGELATELASLVEAELIRVLDLMILAKDSNGEVDVLEFEDLDDLGDLSVLEGQLAEVFSADDVAFVAEAMEPGSVAGLLVWENTWAAPFESAARRRGGRLIATGRIPTADLVAALEAGAAAEADDPP